MKRTVEGLSYIHGKPVSIEIVDGSISDIVVKERVNDSKFHDVYVAPGLIDNQVNGYNSVGFASTDLTVDGVRSVTRAMWQFGVTTYLPTVITSSHERLCENFSLLAAATHETDIGPSIPGFHLEGPYLSPEDGYRGAHNRAWIRVPDWDEFVKVNEAAENKILQVTIAPEVEGAMDFIRNCTKNGIIVAIGHHNASTQIVRRAIDCGAVIATHLGNGCSNMIHRHNNPLWAQLADDRLMASIIVDGFHLRPEEVQVFHKVKGSEHLVIISDITELAGMPAGEYPWNDDAVVVTPGGMIQYPDQNVLAGASFPLSKGVRKMMEFIGCSLEDAIRMASTNPASLNNLNNIGELKLGKRADLILFKIGESELEINKTFIAGKEVYCRDE
ncbi:MAG: N-acetylglucosamine-6-phosphate deacetylase [Gemmatimonadota bacterium]|nr:MAG: N-acetylglucosamine-6-phosphate deacetylase [Gemmatimonadota bacterium]